MKTNHDLTKSEANERKHSVSMSLADAIDWPSVWSAPDDRKDYGELREISLRKANNREIQRYEKATGIDP